MELRLFWYPRGSQGVKEAALPLDYRSHFMAWIKKAVNQWDRLLFWRLYRGNQPKGFHFCVHLPQPRVQGEQVFFCPPFTFRFRCLVEQGEAPLLAALYKHLRDDKQNGLCLNGVRWYVPKKEVKLVSLPFLQFLMGQKKTERLLEVHYRTLSPVFVRSPRDSRCGLLPPHKQNPRGDEGFDTGLYTVLQSQLRFFQGQELEKGQIEFCCHPQQVRRVVVRHLGKKVAQSSREEYRYLKLPCFVGQFKLIAPFQVHYLIYSIGFGSRRSQGFGMLEALAWEVIDR